jgi:hypothetical protein
LASIYPPHRVFSSREVRALTHFHPPAVARARAQLELISHSVFSTAGGGSWSATRHSCLVRAARAFFLLSPPPTGLLGSIVFRISSCWSSSGLLLATAAQSVLVRSGGLLLTAPTLALVLWSDFCSRLPGRSRAPVSSVLMRAGLVFSRSYKA